MSTFFQKLSDTAKATANTIGSKSAELATTGKIKMEIMQISGKIKEKKSELGEVVYYGYTQGQDPNKEAVTELCLEIKSYEDQIAELENQMKLAESEQAQQASAGVACPGCGKQEQPGTAFCGNCGHKLAADLCANCGQNLAPGSKFCAGCGTPA